MKISIKEENGVIIASIEGWLDSSNAEQFMNDMQPLFEQADREIILDCKQLDYTSSSGLRAFLTLRKECAEKGGKVIITNINDEIRKIFTMTGFFNLFEFK